MPEYKDTATRLREASKRNDLPSGIIALLSEAYAEIEQLRAQRDDARRMYCRTITDLRDLFVEQYGADTTPQSVAKEYGWDCFHNSNNQENDNGEE